MTDLVAGEWIKLRTTKVGWSLLAASVAWVLLSVILPIALAGQQGAPSVIDRDGVRTILTGTGASGLFVLVLGALAMTNEWRHGTAVPTFLVAPRRLPVLVAKLALFGLGGLAIGLTAGLLGLAVAVPWLSGKGADVAVTSGTVLLPLVGAGVVGALYGAMGVAVGTLLRNQVLAIVVLVAWDQLVQSLLVGLLPKVGRFLPGGAAQALLGGPNAQLLPPWAGGLLLLGYAAVLALAAAAALRRRDIV